MTLNEKTGELRRCKWVFKERERTGPTSSSTLTGKEGTTESYLSSNYSRFWVRFYSQPKKFLATWTEVVEDGVERLYHFRNYMMLRTAWCYNIAKCVEVPGEETGKSGWADCRCSLWEAGFPEGPT